MELIIVAIAASIGTNFGALIIHYGCQADYAAPCVYRGLQRDYADIVKAHERKQVDQQEKESRYEDFAG